MKIYWWLSVFLFMFNAAYSQQTSASIDETILLGNLHTFQEAVCSHNKQKVETYFNFPVLNEGNDIWYCVKPATDLDFERLNDTIVPFLRSDFNRYYEDLFPDFFVKCLLQVNLKELLDQGSFETGEIILRDTTCRQIADLDKANQMLVLNQTYKVAVPANEKVPDGDKFTEFSVVYFFKIFEKGSLKFHHLYLAG